ncbi:hypothetical protein B0H10DRAFT_2442158 [Mycena sp. CBHHK59/15]|nr:hypothetical protein B0H10DRAFT_2442158 [Mycena sp. CBHHK59/15]
MSQDFCRCELSHRRSHTQSAPRVCASDERVFYKTSPRRALSRTRIEASSPSSATTDACDPLAPLSFHHPSRPAAHHQRTRIYRPVTAGALRLPRLLRRRTARKEQAPGRRRTGLPVPRVLLPHPPPLRRYPRNCKLPSPLQLASPSQVPSPPTPLDERRSDSVPPAKSPAAAPHTTASASAPAVGGARALSPFPAVRVNPPQRPRTAVSPIPTSYPPKYGKARGGPRRSTARSAGTLLELMRRGGR